MAAALLSEAPTYLHRHHRPLARGIQQAGPTPQRPPVRPPAAKPPAHVPSPTGGRDPKRAPGGRRVPPHPCPACARVTGWRPSGPATCIKSARRGQRPAVAPAAATGRWVSNGPATCRCRSVAEQWSLVRRVIDRDGAGGWVHTASCPGVRTAHRRGRAAWPCTPVPGGGGNRQRHGSRPRPNAAVIANCAKVTADWCEMAVGGLIAAGSRQGADSGAWTPARPFD